MNKYCFCQGEKVWRDLCKECDNYFKEKFQIETKKIYDRGFMQGKRSEEIKRREFQGRLLKIHRRLLFIENALHKKIK